MLFRDQGLEVLAFPCNQFGAQESKCALDIKNFAKDTYEAKFPMFEKIEVNGPNAHDVYKFLRGNSDLKVAGGNEVKAIAWNFAHFLVGSDGKVVKAFPPGAEVNDIEEEIKKIVA